MTVNNGKVDVPYLALDPIPVYKENMYDVIIRDGFYTMEEVYRNIQERLACTEISRLRPYCGVIRERGIPLS